MNRKLSIILSIGLQLAFFASQSFASTPDKSDDFADRVNLALRQVGHKLLTLEGDIETPLPAIEVLSPNNYKLSMSSAFNYDSLPNFLHQAFAAYNIDREYHVVVERCQDETLILGYNLKAYTQGDVPCQGRDQVSDCNNILVGFTTPVGLSNDRNMLPLLLFLLIGLCLGGLFAWNLKRKKVSPEIKLTSPESVIESTHRETGILIGKFKFDHQNQTLQLGDTKQNLTFRENKLLYQLVQHKNQIQTRDMLIEEVWADEGVLVGRSLDVFISRLRKLLKADENVAIKNIHGVGYRLELAG